MPCARKLNLQSNKQEGKSEKVKGKSESQSRLLNCSTLILGNFCAVLKPGEFLRPASVSLSFARQAEGLVNRRA